MRNQGNGIAEPIRENYGKVFNTYIFKNLKITKRWKLQWLSELVNGKVGQGRFSNNENPPGIVQWGNKQGSA